MKRSLKIMALMSSVTLITMLLNIIKIKAMALFVGLAGMGIFGLLLSFYSIYLSVGGVVAGGGVVKAVAEARSGGDERKLYVLQYFFTRVAIVLGLFSGIATFLLSETLADLVFGDSSYSGMVRWIGLILVVVNLSLFWQSWLNGCRQVKEMAKVRLYASAFITFFTIIALYFFEEEGILFSILILPFPAFILARYYSSRSALKISPPSIHELSNISGVFRVGIVLVLISVVFQVGVLGARNIILHSAGLEGVGLFFAAWAISMSYIEILLCSLTVDFYPALVGIKDDKKALIKLINDQLQVLLLLIFPAILIMLVFLPYIITLLYSPDFLPAVSILKYQLLGDVFKALSWVFGYVLIVRGHLVFALLLQLFWVGGYLLIIWFGIDLFGLDVAGIGFLISYIFGSLFAYLFLKKKLGFSFSPENWRLLKVIGLIVLVVVLLSLLSIDSILVEIGMLVVALLFVYYSYQMISKNIGGFNWKRMGRL